MLKEAKKALRVTAEEYDSEIASLLTAGARDLEIAGVIIPGKVEFQTNEDETITDLSTVTDELVKRAIFTYAAARFGNPPNYDRIKASYDEQKGTLMHATGYTDYGDGAEAESETESTESASSGGSSDGSAGTGDGDGE